MSLGNESDVLKTNDDFECCCSISRADFDIDGKPIVQIINCILTVPTSLTAILGNLLVLISIWRTPSLHSPSNVLLVGLALSDLGVGLFVQPIFVVYNIAKIKGLMELFCSSVVTLYVTGFCLCGVSLLTLTAISLDRYIAVHLHLRYKEIVTVKRVTAVLVSIWMVGIMCGLLFLWSRTFTNIFSIVLILLNVCITTFAYCKIYRVVRRHQAQIHSQVQQVQVGQQEGNSLNLPQFKKSFVNMLLIYCAFLICYLPYLIVTGLIVCTGLTVSKRSTFEVMLVLLYLNSTLNPFLYCWRFEQIRTAIKKTARDLFFKSSPQ